jgi:hypothetical protein
MAKLIAPATAVIISVYLHAVEAMPDAGLAL